MHIPRRLLFFLAALVLFSSAALALTSEPETLSVACVGDSLTFGTGARNPFTDNWPAVLERTEGSLALDTMNFGVYGRTVSAHPLSGYTATRSYRQSMGAGADVYLVMLGSNDLLLPHWQKSFPKQYRELLEGYMALPQDPEVIVLLPPDLYYKNHLRFTNTLMEDLRAMEQSIAQELGLAVIDLSEISGDMGSYCVDGGHYSSEGYALFADYIYGRLCTLLDRSLLSRL